MVLVSCHARLVTTLNHLKPQVTLFSASLFVFFCSNSSRYDDDDADDGGHSYTLTFNVKFDKEGDVCYFAHCYPYTYSQLQDFLATIQVTYTGFHIPVLILRASTSPKYQRIPYRILVSRIRYMNKRILSQRTLRFW